MSSSLNRRVAKIDGTKNDDGKVGFTELLIRMYREEAGEVFDDTEEFNRKFEESRDAQLIGDMVRPSPRCRRS